MKVGDEVTTRSAYHRWDGKDSADLSRGVIVTLNQPAQRAFVKWHSGMGAWYKLDELLVLESKGEMMPVPEKPSKKPLTPAEAYFENAVIERLDQLSKEAFWERVEAEAQRRFRGEVAEK